MPRPKSGQRASQGWPRPIELFSFPFPRVWGPGTLGPSPQPPCHTPSRPLPYPVHTPSIPQSAVQPARLKSPPGLAGAPWAIKTRPRVIGEALQGPLGTILGPKMDSQAIKFRLGSLKSKSDRLPHPSQTFSKLHADSSLRYFSPFNHPLPGHRI